MVRRRWWTDYKQDDELKLRELQTKLPQIAAEAAEQAGRQLLKLFEGGRISVRRKFDYPGSIVTNADEEAERIILARIRKSGIRSTVVSEEAGKVNLGSDEIVWAVDPLDGTLNYAKRIAYFAVSIGCIFKGKTVAGAIYNPVLDEMFTANIGRGALLNGKRIHVSLAKSLKGASVIFEWWNHEPAIPDPLGLERRLYRFTRSVRSPGSVAMNLCTVASGRFDGLITVFKRSPIYEIAAGCLIVEEAGGRVTNSEGEKWESFKGSVVAGNEVIHARMLGMIRRG
jgi:myo-inositol-1(or 4)-monophosphatase